MKAKITLFFLAAIVMASCSVENEETYPNETTVNLETPGGDDPIICYSTNLIAGQNMTIGTVSYSSDGTTVTITYTITDSDWTIDLTHLWIGDCNDLPTNNPGNPLVGQFPYSESHPGATEYSYTIDVSTLDGFCVAAHAEAIGPTSETAWAEGMPFEGNNWAMYFDVTNCF